MRFVFNPRSMARPFAHSLAMVALTASCGDPQSGDGFGLNAESITIDTNASYTIVGVQSNKCVEVAGGSLADLAPLQIATCNGSTRQQFRAEAMGSGFYRLKNVNSGRCLDVNGASTADGAAVIQYACGTGFNQQWSFTDTAVGIQRVTARHSGKALDVSGRGTADGTRLIQWASSGQTNQQFRLTTSNGSGGGSAGSGGTGSGAGGTAGSGGTGSGTGATGGSVFSQCRFHFGALDGFARSNTSVAQQVDLFTPGWMGTSDTFNQQYVCDQTRPGAALANKVPAIVAYVAAFYAKRHANMRDCNAPGSQVSLCVAGADFIQRNMANVLAVYDSYARGFASCYGTSRPIIFLMEPDFYQYTGSSQSRPWTPAFAGQVMTQYVNAIKRHLPNAKFSLDISPWVAPNNGADNGRSWYANFDMSLFSFINTSGGGTDAASAKIRAANNMTWAGVHQVTGKPILADTGYGVNGAPAGHDVNWDNPTHINARIADGVVAITQYNPSSTWGSTLSSVRPSLRAPTSCP